MYVVDLSPSGRKKTSSILSDFLEKQWRKLEQEPMFKGYLERFEKFITNIPDDSPPRTSQSTEYYSFGAGLSEYKNCLSGLKISIWGKDGEEALFFDYLKRKIFIIRNNRAEEFLPFSSVKYCRLRYRPCIIQNEKVRFQIDFTIASRENSVILKLSDTVSCYDEDRRPYKVQMEPYVKTGKAIAGAGGWSLQVSGSETF